MDIPALNESELSPYFNREDLVFQTAEQVKKDFELFDLEIQFSGKPETAYAELFSQVEPYIGKLIHSNYEKLLNVLYRIDVSEKRVSEAVNESENVSAAITRLII